MIDATATLPSGWETMDLDAVLAVADDERLVWCEQCRQFVPEDESEPATHDPDDDARVCGSCAEAEQQAIRAELERELDAMHRARRAR